MKDHRPEPLPKAKRSTWSIPWQVCKRCGLIYLKNRATDAATRKPCQAVDDPQK